MKKNEGTWNKKLHLEAVRHDLTLHWHPVVQHDLRKPNYDSQVLQGAYDKQGSILAYEQDGIFSGHDGVVAYGVPWLKIEDTDGSFKFAKREHEGTLGKKVYLEAVWYESALLWFSVVQHDHGLAKL